MKYAIIVITALFALPGCTEKNLLVGTWEEIKYKEERIIFDENGNMKIEFKDSPKENPINFKYEITSNKNDCVEFKVTVYNRQELVKTAMHKATFETKDKITIQNTDDPSVRSNTYTRIRAQ